MHTGLSGAVTSSQIRFAAQRASPSAEPHASPSAGSAVHLAVYVPVARSVSCSGQALTGRALARDPKAAIARRNLASSWHVETNPASDAESTTHARPAVHQGPFCKSHESPECMVNVSASDMHLPSRLALSSLPTHSRPAAHSPAVVPLQAWPLAAGATQCAVAVEQTSPSAQSLSLPQATPADARAAHVPGQVAPVMSQRLSPAHSASMLQSPPVATVPASAFWHASGELLSKLAHEPELNAVTH